MVTAVISKLLAPFWRKIEEDEEDGCYGMVATEEVRHLEASEVTLMCTDYGMIDNTVYFTPGEVLGGVPLQVGDTVNGIAARDTALGGWKALRVEKSSDAWEDGGRASLETDTNQLQSLIGTVTSLDRDGGFINQTTFFPRHALIGGFEPMKGDWVQAQYFISPTQWSTQASSVSPLRYRRMDQVRVSSAFGSCGVVEDSVFFSLDSLLLPAGYRPRPGDEVSLVVVESSQSFYCWRALCMAPSEHSMNAARSTLPEAEIQSLLEDKGGLVVSDKTGFGALLLGESRELVVWIQNQGSETHRFKCCEFAGWDSEEQFTLGHVREPASPGQRKGLLQKPGLTQMLYGRIHGAALSAMRNPMLGLALNPVAVPTRQVNGHGTESDELEGDEEAPENEEDVPKPAIRTEERDLEIAPGEKVSVRVGCRAKNLGRCSELLLLHFPSFSIGRRLEVMVDSKEESLLQPFAPYCPAAPLLLPQHAQVITVRPTKIFSLQRRHLPNFLPNYPLPQALRDCVEAQNDVLVAQPCLGETLSQANIHPRFSALLWLEELQAERDLREFSLSGALLRKGPTYLHLEVLGVAEGRPNLFIGDRVALKRPPNGGVVTEYIGYVTEINEEDVSLRVNKAFHQGYLGELLDVEFSFNRLTMRRCHLALDHTRSFGEKVLFPSAAIRQAPLWTGEWVLEENTTEENKGAPTEDRKKTSSVSIDMVSKATQTKIDGRTNSQPIPKPGHFFNRLLNPSQKEAVKHILAGECRPTPYVLFGPPGTGKTITLIEAILQVYYRLPCSRVLVCTPSNSAADLICLRLHNSGFLDAGSLARVNASCRREESISEVLRPYSAAGEDIRKASYHRIVVSTCSSAGMFYQINMQVGHFTHVFLDEAGQATEPEALIPMGLLLERDGQIVLTGDPHQLGPVVKSKVASLFGLGVSLLERLMARSLYSRQEGGYNPRLVTKLIYNYRSHEALLALPSRLFYQGELCVRAQRAVVDSLCHWSKLPTKGFPFIFHGVRGTEMREGNNPSWFNPGEAVQVMLYCCQLAKKLYDPVAASDIGVIAPYRKQSQKIRVLLDRVGLSDIKVGSVEEFQGQEYLVIILSTVRSNEALGDDLQSILGFMANPKRFNVAITRPKALLIVVGNPHILIKDPCFAALLQYSFENGAFLGCDPPPSLRPSHRAVKENEKL